MSQVPEAEIEARLLAYAEGRVHPQVRAWSNITTITANLQEEMEGDLERYQSDALAAEFRHHCAVARAEQDDYKNRFTRVGELELLTGIRFRGLDMTQPFVDVIYQSRPALSSEQVTEIKDELRAEYAVFLPKRLRVYQPSHLKPLPGDGDKRLIAAPLQVVSEGTRGEEGISLRPARSLEFYPDYAAIYTQLHAEHPELIPVTRAESEDDLKSYLAAGNLFSIYVDETWAGVCAVFSDVSAGIRGFCFGEIVLEPAFRGRRLGSLVQQRLTAHLLERGEDPNAFLFGTIGSVNEPAKRAAARAGRLDLGGHVWLDL